MYPQESLKELEEQIRIDFENANFPPKNWIIEETNHEIPVAIIGAGMSALCLSLALKAQGIPSILFEKKKEGDEGPWKEPALMQTLRSPKNLTGPALISPSLTFQAWFKAQFSHQAWESLDKIPRLQWDEYLKWFKKITQPTIYYESELVDLHIADQLTEIMIRHSNQDKIYHVVHCVLAMGIDSLSSPNIPELVQNIPNYLWQHNYDTTNYECFKGLNVAVIGASAGAMDSAATVLEHGAKSVEIICRCNDFPRVNRSKSASNVGYFAFYPEWSDQEKWDFQTYLRKEGTPAPHRSVLRVAKHKNAYFNFSETLQNITFENQKLYLSTKHSCFIVDRLIFATGFKINWHKYKWLYRFSQHIKIWRDINIQQEKNLDLENYPYLTKDFEFIHKASNESYNIYCFNYASALSQGPLVGMISGLSHGAMILAEAITRKYYKRQLKEQIQLIKESRDFELNGDEWCIDQKDRETKICK